MSIPEHLWENRNIDEFEDNTMWGCYSGDEDDLDTELTPGMEFVRSMLELYFSSTLSAIVFCKLMWLAANAGIREAGQYALKPGAPTGHYSRKLRRQLGWRTKHNFMRLTIPGQGKHDLERSEQTVSVMPGHEQMSLDLKDTPVTATMLQKLKDKPDNIPPCYWHHPVVQEAAQYELVYPVAVYLDGVPYSHTDGVLGFWLINLVDGRRFLMAVIRKRIICKCGCRGWCTFYHIFRYIHWSLAALACGEYPGERYNGTFLEDGSDASRQALAKTKLGFKAACLYIKGDWMELATTIGLPMWVDSLRPCFNCNAYLHNFYETLGTTLDALVWIENGDDDYFEACARCEHIVTLRNSDDLQKILRLLRYDKRKDGSRGRALVGPVDVAGVSLCAGDRLEPSLTLTDIGNVEYLNEFPQAITFWRPSSETLTRHRNPIFDSHLGITPRKSLVIDLLHAVFLGILLVWCRLVIWKLLECGVYGILAGRAEAMQAAVLLLRSKLMRFYPKYEKEHPGEILTRVSDLTQSMLGEPSDHKLKTKGAETWGIALFLLSELQSMSHRIPVDGQRMIAAGEQLIGVIRMWKSHGWTMPAASSKDFEP